MLYCTLEIMSAFYLQSCCICARNAVTVNNRTICYRDWPYHLLLWIGLSFVTGNNLVICYGEWPYHLLLWMIQDSCDSDWYKIRFSSKREHCHNSSLCTNGNLLRCVIDWKALIRGAVPFCCWFLYKALTSEPARSHRLMASTTGTGHWLILSSGQTWHSFSWQ